LIPIDFKNNSEQELRDAEDSLQYGKLYRERHDKELQMRPYCAARSDTTVFDHVIINNNFFGCATKI
jgi:hypothetical protein